MQETRESRVSLEKPLRHCPGPAADFADYRAPEKAGGLVMRRVEQYY